MRSRGRNRRRERHERNIDGIGQLRATFIRSGVKFDPWRNFFWDTYQTQTRFRLHSERSRDKTSRMRQSRSMITKVVVVNRMLLSLVRRDFWNYSDYDLQKCNMKLKHFFFNYIQFFRQIYIKLLKYFRWSRSIFCK